MAKVTMPQLGESVAEGTIGKWLKQPGDTVEKYEPLVEVITDKVNAEVPSPFAGVLKEILVEEGATVPPGPMSAPNWLPLRQHRRHPPPLQRPQRRRQRRPPQSPPRRLRLRQQSRPMHPATPTPG